MRSHFMPTGMALTEKTKRDQTGTENGKYWQVWGRTGTLVRRW